MRKLLGGLLLLLLFCGIIFDGKAEAEENVNAEVILNEDDGIKGEVNLGDEGKNNGDFQVIISNLEHIEFIDTIQVAVWGRENGQNDIRWYNAERLDQTYYCKFSVMDHGELGIYYAHAYAMTLDGQKIYLGGDSLMIESPYVNNICINSEDNVKGTFQLHMSDIVNKYMLESVQLAVWSEEDGQDDIQWYTFQIGSEDDYFQEIDIKNHKYSLGKYIIHVYFTDIMGNRYYVGGATHKISINCGEVSFQKNSETEFNITFCNYNVPGGIEAVVMPIWSEENGQDDLRWYNAKKNADGSYSVNLNIKDHKNLGKYISHVYVVTHGGKNVFVNSLDMLIDAPHAQKFSITDYDIERGTFRIEVSEILNESLIKKIVVPVWCEEKGQDDIKWYNAVKNDDGKYYVDVDIKNHNYQLGNYIAHMYICDITNGQNFGGQMDQRVEIMKGKLSIYENNGQEYKIDLRDVAIPGGIKKVTFAVWNNLNGQDDIQWYYAKENENGIYERTISIANHKGLGRFIVHAYAEMENGHLLYVNGSNFETKLPVIGNITIDNADKAQGEFKVKITGVKNDELIKEIVLPIWAEDNQKDIVWYKATKNMDGDYVANVNISRHAYRCSMYKIHVYVTDITEGKNYMGSTSCDMEAEYNNFSAIDLYGTEISYEISLHGLKVPGGEKNIYFAVWGEKDGQNDIKWYKADKEGEGKYSYTLKIKDHKEFGKYSVHGYCTSKGDMQQFLGETKFEVTKKPQFAEAIGTDINGTTGTFKITISGVMAPSGVEQVLIPIWCAENQSDIVWYKAVKIEDGIFTALVDVKKHANHFGMYKAHIYVAMGNGICLFAGDTSVVIEPHNYIYNKYVSETQREVGIMGTEAERVLFPSWSEENGQDDLVWYEGINRGNGLWTAIIDSSNHNSGGSYITHVYSTMNEMTNAIGATTYFLQWIPSDQRLMEIKANMYSSSTPFLILVNRSTHKVGVFQGWQGNWNCIQYWDCADGAVNTPTVEGIFRVGIKGYYFDSGASRCFWYTQFYGNYLFHSVLYNKNGSLQDGRVGMALSHGCVRLLIQNAKWIYDTIPSNTTVVVYH